MLRRSGQFGYIVRKGKQWHVRFYVDGKEGRFRKSVSVGPAVGPQKLTKAEASRKGAEIVESHVVNTEAHLRAAKHPESVETFRQRVIWCRKYHRAWLESKPASIIVMDNHLNKHLIPRFGDMTIAAITETRVQEFIADLGRATFEQKKPNGDVIRTYKLSRKSILNVVGVLKLVVGRKHWKEWDDIDLGRPARSTQRYFTDEQLGRIIEAAEGQYKVLFALLAGTGMRIGEAAGLCVEDVDLDAQVIRVRRGIFNGQEITPKTDAGVRDVDIDETLNEMLKDFIGDRKSGRLFATRRGTPLAHGNIRNRVLTPLLKTLGIPKAGLHAFRHSRVTMLRKARTPEDLQKRWIGHSSLAIGDRYNHASEEVEYRRAALSHVGLDRIVRPNGPKSDSEIRRAAEAVKATA
jgi:integrase